MQMDEEADKNEKAGGDDNDSVEEGDGTSNWNRPGKGNFDRETTKEYRPPERLDCMRALGIDLHVGDEFPSKNDLELRIREVNEMNGKLIKTGNGIHPMNDDQPMRNSKTFFSVCCAMDPTCSYYVAGKGGETRPWSIVTLTPHNCEDFEGDELKKALALICVKGRAKSNLLHPHLYTIVREVIEINMKSKSGEYHQQAKTY